tara:strand:- start:16459 stop:17430 length:972 start_codon:yes stop_codon:yes gene_type:complete
VGYGSIGKRHIQNLSNYSDIEIIVCTKRKQDIFLKKNKCKVIKSLKKSISENPDFAIISNVTSLHIETAIELANAGIHFLIEKPLSHNQNGVKKLLNVIKTKKLITLIGCHLRFHPCIIKIKEIIEKKKIGKVLAVQAQNSSYLPDWHPYENYKESYAAKKELGGGVVLTSIHELDYLYWLFGKINDVFSISDKSGDLELSCDDMSSSLLKFKAGIVGEVHLDFFQKTIIRQCNIIGTKGIISCNINLNRIKLYNPITKKWSVQLELKNYDINEVYKRELDHFIKCVKNNKKSINDVGEGINVLKIALSIIKSSKIKKMVHVK